MRLKKIAIHGFKSFADKAHVEFGPGITAIVGPNGCGKSNIIDAFRWVMGEQSAKAIRGERMIDLIFAGTASRKPLNFAEVSLTFCNEERKLPLDVSEVAVSRRIHRDGESLFAINKAAARLKDIETLFWDTGLGKDAFSIFEQGKLDQIITSAPYERRLILEEAAGIMRFKQRKKEALKKLSLTEENLIRLKDIIQLTLQKKMHLIEQGEKARIYQELETKATELEKCFALFEMKKLEDKLARQVKQLEKNLALLESLKEELFALEQQRKEMLQKRERSSQAHQEAVKAVYEKSASIELKKQRLAWLQKQKETFLSKEDKICLEQEEITKQLSDLENEKAELLERLQKEKEEALSYKTLTEALSVDLKKIREEEALLWKEKTAYSERKMARLREENRLKNQYEESVFKLQAAKDKCANLEAEEERLVKEIELLQAESVDIEALKKAVDTAKSCLSDLQEREKELLREEKERQSQEIDFARKASALQGKISALEELKKSLQGYSPAAKNIIAKGLARPLSEVLSWKEDYEKMLARYEHLLIVKSADDLERILAEENVSDVALFCLSWLEGRSLEEHFVAASRLENLPKTLYKDAIGSHFWIDSKGVLFLSSKGPSTVFSRKRELDTLTADLKALEKQLEEIKAAKKKLLQDKEALQIGIEQARSDLQSKEMQKGAAEASLLRIKREKERLGQLLSNIFKEKEALKKLCEELLAKKDQAENALKGFTAEEEAEPAFETRQSALLDKRQSLENEFKGKNRFLEQITTSINQHEPRLAHLKAKETSLRERGALLIKEKEECLLGLQNCEEEDLCFVAEEEQELALLTTKEEEIHNQVKELFAVLESSELDIAAKTEEKEKGQALVERSTLEKAQNETALQMLEERYKQQFGEKEPYPEKQPEGNLLALKDEMAAMGPINFSAAEELAEAEKEAEELNHQIADLEQAKTDLYAVISSLDKESGERFLATFAAVKSAFQKNFSTLFGGGTADLQLVGSEDPLEAGLDIYAMPPGKAMKSLYLMSGGERCLTALALMFALFEVRPSPFCLLDEVDAPLDEANVERFAKMVSSYIDKTQFVIITHNKNTMAIADRLLGVSAEEKGVSRVIPLELKTCR